MIMANDNNIQPEADDSQIVLYQPDESISLHVKIDGAFKTVWLSLDQMAELFGRDRSVIGKHVRTIFKEGELQKDSVWAKFAYTASDGKTYQVDTQAKQQQQLDFFIRTSTPPAEMVFFEGDFYTARVALENLIRTANHRVIIIDGYVSSLTLSVLDVRKSNVTATIYTVGVGQGMQRLMEEHDRLFPNNHIDIRRWSNESHDRWLIIDDSLYHCGHSLNANGGHKISAITLMGTSPEVILSKVE